MADRSGHNIPKTVIVKPANEAKKGHFSFSGGIQMMNISASYVKTPDRQCSADRILTNDIVDDVSDEIFQLHVPASQRMRPIGPLQRPCADAC